MNLNRNHPKWNPPHCPNPHCSCHIRQPHDWHYRRIGFFTRQKPPHRVQRFLCLHCRKAFSTQSFQTTYWLKRPELLIWVFKLSVGGMANRQIARALDCAPATVDNMLARLGRHCLLFHRQMVGQASPFSDIVIDGLVSFEHSQYFPFEHLVAVDRNSSFFIHFTDAPLRRSGTMTPYQKKKRQRLESELGRPDPRAVEKGMREVVQQTLTGVKVAVVRSDKHRAYPRVLRQVDCQIQHRRIDSRLKRDNRNELFEVNCLDMLIRHCGKNHTRETIAFSKRRQGSAERLAVLLVWRNYVKRRWEKGRRETPAMLVGLADRVFGYGEVLRRRLFPGLVALPNRWRDYYWRRVLTPVLGVNRRHEWVYAA
jgi:transposase-like protein